MAAYTPPVGFHFRVDFAVPGLLDNDASFMEVQGLTQTLDTTTLEEGGFNGYSHKLPTKGSFQNLVLKRGLNVNSIVYFWAKAALDFHVFLPIPITVTLLNANHNPTSVWQFFRAYPVKWSVSDFNAKSNEVVIETMELAYAYFMQLNIPGTGA